jgi:23S rRNA pseudouridine2605 synthase
MSERVQKILSQAGIASRRKAEELILEGLVTINGKVAQLGDKAELGVDAIKVGGKLIHTAETPVYVALNKPKGVISMMTDPEGRPTIGDCVSRIKARIYPVGRLDFMSEGLMLLTNDGEFAEQLQKREDIPRIHHVKVKGHPDHEMLERVTKGAKLGDRFVKPHSVRVVESLKQKAKIEVVIMGGGTFDLKALFEMKGFLVERISRVGIGHITLHGMAPGEYRLLKKTQIEALLTQPELAMRALESAAEKQRERDVRQAAYEEKKAAREERRGGRGAEPGTRGAPRAGERPVRASREERGARAERGGIGGKKPFGAKRFGERAERGPRREERSERGSFGAKRFGERAERGPRREERSERGSFGAKRFGERAERGPRREERSERGSFGKSFGGKRYGGAGTGADRGARDERGGFGKKPFGTKRFGKRSDRGPRRDDRGPRRDDSGPRKPRGGTGIRIRRREK